MLGSGGATVALLTTPCFAGRERSDGGTWPENDPSRVTRLNGLIRDVAARHPGKVEVVDLYGMLCPGGQYEQQLDGVTVRRADGVHIQPGSGAWLQSHLLPILHQIGERHCSPPRPPTEVASHRSHSPSQARPDVRVGKVIRMPCCAGAACACDVVYRTAAGTSCGSCLEHIANLCSQYAGPRNSVACSFCPPRDAEPTAALFTGADQGRVPCKGIHAFSSCSTSS